MNQHFRDVRKIDPSRGPVLGDGTPNDGDRIEGGPTALARAEWAAAGLEEPNLAAMRAFRHARLTEHVAARGWDALLMFDPLNIRYATDCPNMQLWNTHNPFRCCVLLADGHMVLWDYKNSPFLASFNPLVKETRTGADFFYFDKGDLADEGARRFAADVDALLRERGFAGRRIGIDKVMMRGLRAFEALGYEVFEGEECTEKSRSVKGPDEILAMRCAMHSCEAAMQEMEDFARAEIPGGNVTEDDVWAVLHAANIRRGGEWIETRLLASGPRTNPWFQECGPRVCRENEILAFDTDLVGAYGICCDLSRTWWIGDGPARPDMIRAMRHGLEHIRYNETLLRVGRNIEEMVQAVHPLAPEYQAQKYGCFMHGVGLCDEWPLVAYPDKAAKGAYDYPLEAGMCLCVEALVSEVGADFSIKLEDQVLLTEDGPENLTRYPFDPRLTGDAP